MAMNFKLIALRWMVLTFLMHCFQKISGMRNTEYYDPPQDTYYEEDTARLLADFSGIAYCKYAEGWGCEICKKYPNVNATFVNSDSLSAMVAFEPSSSRIITAFRGTDPLSLLDWLDDLEFRMIKYDRCKDCRVHRGFYKAYNEIVTPVRETFKDYIQMFPNASLAVTGHSLGASFAVFFADEISSNSFFNSESMVLYTFGQPRIGNAQFAGHISLTFQNRCFRVTHCKDPVPHVPFKFLKNTEASSHFSNSEMKRWLPHILDFGRLLSEPENKYYSSDQMYTHNSQEVFYPYEDFNQYIICNGGEDPSCSGQYIFDLLFVEQHWHYLDTNFAYTTFLC